MTTRVRVAPNRPGRRAVRSPVQVRSRATVDAILGGTARVLASRGYVHSTTNHIADVAGVSIGSFYQYFENKDAAIAACATRFAEESLDYSHAHLIGPHPGRTRVEAWLDALYARACQQESLLKVLFEEVPYIWSIPGVRAAIVAAVDAFEHLHWEEDGDRVIRHDRAYVIVKAAIVVMLDVAASSKLRERGHAVICELSAMIDAYLATDRTLRD